MNDSKPSDPDTPIRNKPRRRARKAAPVVAEFASLGRILDREDLSHLPKPEPLIEGWLDLRTVVVMPGDTGTNKTFVATVGWACSVATGTPWLGNEVRIEPSTVILVVGEGEHGLDVRISAWEQEHGISVPRHRIRTIIRPTMDDDDGDFWTDLAEFAFQAGARFIVFDTLSSLIPGIDETKEAAQVIAVLHDIAARIDGTVVLLHHTGWGDKTRSRGGAQFEQNSDAVIVLQKIDHKNPETSPVSIWRKKVKDGPSGATMYVERVPVGESCVLKEVGASAEGVERLSRSDIVSAIFRLLDAAPLMHTSDSAQKLLMEEIGSGTTRTNLRGVWRQAAADSLIRHQEAKGQEGKSRRRWERVPAAEVPPTPRERRRG